MQRENANRIKMLQFCDFAPEAQETFSVLNLKCRQRNKNSEVDGRVGQVFPSPICH